MKNKIENAVSTTLETLDASVVKTTTQIDSMLSPARESFAKRSPTLFSLLATIGVVMTFLGLEQLLLAFSLLERYPVIILGVGIALLALTGTLYKK